MNDEPKATPVTVPERSPDYMRKASADSRVIQVIQTRSIAGDGVKGDPIRAVWSYFLLDGTPLAEVDPYMEGDPRLGHSYLKPNPLEHK